MTQITDQDARRRIMERFYEAYKLHGLNVLVMVDQVMTELSLDVAQARRCFDYLRAKGLIRPMTLGGGYSPTVGLVDEIETNGSHQ